MPQSQSQPRPLFFYTRVQAKYLRTLLDPDGKWSDADWQRNLDYITGRAQQAVAMTAARERKPTRLQALKQLWALEKALANLSPLVQAELQASLVTIGGPGRFTPELVREAIWRLAKRWEAEPTVSAIAETIARVKKIDTNTAKAIAAAHKKFPAKPPTDFPDGRPPEHAARYFVTALCLFYCEVRGDAPTVYPSQHAEEKYDGKGFMFLKAALRHTGLVPPTSLGSVIHKGYQDYKALCQYADAPLPSSLR